MKGCNERLRWLYWLFGFAVIVVPHSCAKHGPPGYKPTHKGARYLDRSKVQFDDGDTFLLSGKAIRFIGIDTPETIDSSVGIYENQPYGIQAAESTKAWILGATLAEYLPDGKDVYGRRLAHVFVDGELLAVRLIRHGLAYETVTHYGDCGFPDLAREILEVSLTSPKPKFQKPYLWRRKHQKKI